MEFFAVIGILLILYYFIHFTLLCLVDCDLTLAWCERFGKKLIKLQDKVTWITGASSGIGEAMAYQVAQNGGKLVLSARRHAELSRVQARCFLLNTSLTVNDILVLPLDVTQHDTHQSSFDHVLQHFGQLDVLINNAGRSQRATWEEIEVDVDKQVFDLNVFGVISLTRLAVKYFNSRGKGKVAVTSSIAGFVGVPFSASYTASKHAIHGYYQSLRLEKMGSNIGVTILCPGPVFTNFLSESFTEKLDEKYGTAVGKGDRRMTAERCAFLSLIAIVNKLDMAWIALFPFMPLLYTLVYFPNLAMFIAKHVGIQQRIQKLRDSRVTVQ